jgi:hypothetical protein
MASLSTADVTGCLCPVAAMLVDVLNVAATRNKYRSVDQISVVR